MKEKIFIINFFDKKEMKWYEKEEINQNQVKTPMESGQQHRYEHTKWYHETGKPPVEAPQNEIFPDEFVTLPPLLPFEEFKPYMPEQEDKEFVPSQKNEE